MNPQISHDEPQVNRTTMNELYYVEKHGFDPESFAVRYDVSSFTGIRIIDEDGSGEFEDFDGFDEAEESPWTVRWVSPAMLSDGTMLYEGRR